MLEAPAARSRPEDARRRRAAQEAVELALAGASKVIEQNLESDKNRKLVRDSPDRRLKVARQCASHDRQELR